MVSSCMVLTFALETVTVKSDSTSADRTIHLAFGWYRAMNGVAMNTFTIDVTNNITAFASPEEARAAKINNAESFGSAQELAKLRLPGLPAARRQSGTVSPARSPQTSQAREEIHEPQSGCGTHLGGAPALLANVGKPAATPPAKGKPNKDATESKRRHAARAAAKGAEPGAYCVRTPANAAGRAIVCTRSQVPGARTA